MRSFIALVLLLGRAVDVTAFTSTTSKTLQHCVLSAQESESPETVSDEEEERPKLESFLAKKYPTFYDFLNDDMAKAIKQGTVTVFVPNDAAFEKLGEKKLVRRRKNEAFRFRHTMISSTIVLRIFSSFSSTISNLNGTFSVANQ